MKKITALILLLCAAILGLFYIEKQKNKVFIVDGSVLSKADIGVNESISPEQEETVNESLAPIAVEISYDMGKIRLEPWYDTENDLWYVFFPSYITTNRIHHGKLSGGELFLREETEADPVSEIEKSALKESDQEKALTKENEKESERKKAGNQGRFEKNFTWENGRVYGLTYGEHEMRICFLKSEHLSSVFIETDSKNNEIIRAAKENIEEGNILSLDHTGKMEYHGKMHISGHGNAWQFYEKRAYDIELRNQGTLAGIDGGTKWKLLHLSNDGDKIHSKLAFDIADILGAEYTPQAIWVNLYLNGEYHGMYLLTTAARDQNVFKTPEAVFLEKDLQDRYEIEEHIISKEGNGFVIHRPNNVTVEKKSAILEDVNKIERSIAAGEPDQELIDLDSFAVQFLVDEIAFNSDGFETSAYLYQLAEGTCFYAGPAWDYDAGFGEALHVDPKLSNVQGSVLDGEPTELTWYQKLYEQPEFLRLVAAKYEAALPELKELYEETIDLYADYIAASVKNDEVRWKGNFQTMPKTGVYQTWENNLRYLKYFTMNRYNALKERWNIEAEDLVWENEDQLHQVKVLYGGEEKEFSLEDGQQIPVLTDLEKVTIEEGGEGIGLTFDAKIRFRYSEEEYTSYLPILEDVVLTIKKDPVVQITDTVKQVRIPKEIFAESYQYVSIFAVNAAGENITVQTMEEIKEEICLEFPVEDSGFVAIYVFADETGAEILEEIVIDY